MSKGLLEILKKSTLFAHVPDKVLASIHDSIELLWLPAGMVLFNEGDPGDGLYLIVEGKLEVRSSGVLLVTRGPGEYVGELALLDDVPRSATVRTITDVSLMKLHRDAFHRILATSSGVVSALLRSLGQKIREDSMHHIAIVRQQEHLQYDLKRAREIQIAMLPGDDLVLDWMHLTGKSQPAEAVGGDYYDYFQLPDGCVSLAIGDVAGHGLYSSLLVAIVSSTLRLQVEIDRAPVSVMTVLNKVVRNYRHTRMLMTFSYLLMNPAKRKFSFINAGHPYPYLYRHHQQKWTTLERDSLPLGTNLPTEFTPVQVEWEPRDRLFLYSDGLVETQNDRGELYGSDSLRHFLDRRAALSSGDMIRALEEELEHYSNGWPTQDDFTVVVVQFL